MPLSRTKYSGVLATPIVVQPNGSKPRTILDLDVMDAAAQERFDADLILRRSALYSFYGIADDGTLDSSEALAMALACDHVPGMRIATGKSGRPKGGAIAAIDVFQRVEAYREERFGKTKRRPNVAAAIRELKKQKASGFGGLAESTLRNHHTDGKREAEASAILWRNAWWRPRGRRIGTILDLQGGD